MKFDTLWNWLVRNGSAVGVVVAVTALLATLTPIVWAVVQYILIRRAENNRLRFTTFHHLIKQLVERETPDQPMRIDRQIAVIYELRSFKSYYPVTLRILKGLRTDWEHHEPVQKWKRLHEEIDLAIEHISPKA